MRHRYRRKKLNRARDHRLALFKNLIRSLITHEEIKTTESKARAIRKIFDKLVTKGKERTVHARRLIHAFLQDKKVVSKLVDKLAPMFQERKGGFTRIVRLGQRRGDGAMMVKLELVSKIKKEKPEESKKKKRQLSRGDQAQEALPRRRKLSLKRREKKARRRKRND